MSRMSSYILTISVKKTALGRSFFSEKLYYPHPFIHRHVRQSVSLLIELTTDMDELDPTSPVREKFADLCKNDLQLWVFYLEVS